ncbi:hypothetical protein [Poseidonibacter lekithochrous]|uniref:hypothetical protein n=1 Tax=Poseidonibacter lekithochrous TaxID=1904463 RepID=UPI000D3BEE15|nr:hypothetical protein [Poseidonibacter lekithochrous]
MAETTEKTFAEQMVEKLQAILLGKADNDVLEYEIGGRQLKKYSFDELERMRSKYRNEVAAEKRTTRQVVRIRF